MIRHHLLFTAFDDWENFYQILGSLPNVSEKIFQGGDAIS
jgi:hypothetical protein